MRDIVCSHTVKLYLNIYFSVDSISDVLTVSQIKARNQEHADAFHCITYAFITMLELGSSISKIIRNRWWVSNAHIVLYDLLCTNDFIFALAPNASSKSTRTVRPVPILPVQIRDNNSKSLQALRCWWISVIILGHWRRAAWRARLLRKPWVVR